MSARSTLEVVTPAPSRALIDLATARALVPSLISVPDATLTAWIAAASAAIERHCRRVFVAETVREVITPEIGRSIGIWLLARWPLGTVQAVEDVSTGLAVPSSAFEVIDRATGTLWLDRDRPTAIRYVGGYATLPPDLVAIAATALRHLVASADRAPGLIAEELDGYSYRLETGAAGAAMLPPGVIEALAAFEAREVAP